MGHASLSNVASESFGNQVSALVGDTPAEENAGMPAWATTTLLPYFATWLQSYPGKYVTINLGTNDAASGVSPSAFYANMSTLVQDVLALGKTPVVPTIPWSRDPWHAQHIPALNAEIHHLYHTCPAVIPGPDLFTFFNDHQDYISADNVHPTEAGYAALRTLWAAVAAQSIYQRK